VWDALATDVGGAFDKALRAAIRLIYEHIGMPEDWRKAKEELWKGMRAKLWLNGMDVGYVEWENGVLQGGVLSPQDYLILTVYVHARVDQQKFTSFKVKQFWFADDALYWLDPRDAQKLLMFLVDEYHELFMDLRADKTEASVFVPAGTKCPLNRLMVPIVARDLKGPPVATPKPDRPDSIWDALCPRCTKGIIEKRDGDGFDWLYPLSKEGHCTRCDSQFHPITVRRDCVPLMGGNVALSKHASIPQKTRKKVDDIHCLWHSNPELKISPVVMTHNSICLASLATQQAASLLPPAVTQPIWQTFRDEIGPRLGWEHAHRLNSAYLQAPPPYGLGQ
jgi:hypothetical protein